MPATGASSAEQDQQIPERRAGLDRGDRERADDADPDKRRDPRDARCHDDREPPPPRLDDPHQRAQRRQPRRPSRGLGIGRGRRRLAVIGRLAAAPRASGEFLDREVEIVAALLGLRAHQPAIGAVAADQLGVPAALDDAAMVEHEDAVGADHARQPVRQDQGRAPLRQPVERLLDHRLVLGIDRGQRLVEDQDRRIAQQRPRDRQTLALSARQIDAALADRSCDSPAAVAG